MTLIPSTPTATSPPLDALPDRPAFGEAPAPPPVLPLPAEGAGSLEAWKARIRASTAQMDRKKRLWQKNTDAYQGQVLREDPQRDTVIVPKDFANVEQKSALLFFQRPEVRLTPKEPRMAGQEAIAALAEAVLNDKLGPNGVDAMTCVDECKFDVLCPAGLAFSKIGYEAIVDGTKRIQVGVQPAAVQPPPAPGSVLGLQPPVMEPMWAEVPNIIHERYFWDRFSPLKGLIPVEFHGSNYDQAAWLGMEYLMPTELARARYGLDDTLTGTTSDDHLLIPDPGAAEGALDRVRIHEIWYKASLFDPSERHPQKIRELVLIEGVEEPVVHRDSPNQRFDATGKFVAGMEGFPIHILTLRYLGDSAYPPSDCTISRAQVDELSKGRTQMILARDRSLPMRFADLGRVGGVDGLAKLEKNINNAIVPLDGGSERDSPVWEVARAQFPRENWQFNEIIDRDVETAWALGPNQLGVQTPTQRTATEAQLIQSNVNVRLQKEQRRILQWYIQGAMKLFALCQVFGDEEEFVEILGPDGAKQLAAWDKTRIQGRFAFEAKPDSALHLDAAQDRRDALNEYQMLRKDPLVNQLEFLKVFLRRLNYDPAKLLPAQPPAKAPDAPNVSFRFNGADLDPRSPQARLLYEILQQAGVMIDPVTLASVESQAAAPPTEPGGPIAGPPLAVHGGRAAPPQLEHGGAVEGVEPMSQHFFRRGRF